MRIWSELPRRRTQELTADIATAVWVVVWVTLGIRLYGALANLAIVGTSLGDAGDGLRDAGATIENALTQIPLIGEGAGNVVGDAFDAVGSPLVEAGADLERLLLIIAAVLGLLLVAVALIPWLNRYIPWRRARWQRLNAGDRAIRQSAALRESRVSTADVQRVLATRALYRLEYADLLDKTPDPIGDFVEGRYALLASAELENVGLKERAEGGG
jgi:hypothetical protein